MNNERIACPKCGSDQLTADKKGFSGKKAVVGAVLTGGLGLLAGTLGSNKIKITCLACGKEFKPGEGKIVSEQALLKDNPSTSGSSVKIHSADEAFIINRIKSGGMLSAVTAYKEFAGISLEEAKNIVDEVANKRNAKPKANSGCAGVFLFLTLLITGIFILYF